MAHECTGLAFKERVVFEPALVESIPRAALLGRDHRLALTEFDSFRHLLSASPPIPFVRGNELEHTCNFDADLQLLRSRGWSRLTGVFPPGACRNAGWT